MFRVTVRTQAVAGDIHYHLTGYRLNSTHAFVVAELHSDEWPLFLEFAQEHQITIEVFSGAIQAHPTEAPTAK